MARLGKLKRQGKEGVFFACWGRCRSLACWDYFGPPHARFPVSPSVFHLPSKPTNNLDLEAVVALADAVESFEGGVVVVRCGADSISRVEGIGPQESQGSRVQGRQRVKGRGHRAARESWLGLLPPPPPGKHLVSCMTSCLSVSPPAPLTSRFSLRISPLSPLIHPSPLCSA